MVVVDSHCYGHCRRIGQPIGTRGGLKQSTGLSAFNLIGPIAINRLQRTIKKGYSLYF